MGGNPESAELAAAEQSLTYAVVSEVGEVATTNMECFAGSVALRPAVVGTRLCTEVRINLEGVVFQLGHALPPTPFRGRSFILGYVNPVNILTLHEPKRHHHNRFSAADRLLTTPAPPALR